MVTMVTLDSNHGSRFHPNWFYLWYVNVFKKHRVSDHIYTIILSMRDIKVFEKHRISDHLNYTIFLSVGKAKICMQITEPTAIEWQLCAVNHRVRCHRFSGVSRRGGGGGFWGGPLRVAHLGGGISSVLIKCY